jgi:transcriptional regulator with XRE-family HTH domain
MKTIARALVEAGEKYSSVRVRFSLDRLSKETGISVASLRRLFSDRRNDEKIPYETVRKILNAFKCSFAEFQELRNDRTQLTLLRKYEAKKRKAEDDAFVARLHKEETYCKELGRPVTLGRCHDCWANLHDEVWRHKMRKQSRCREIHMGLKARTQEERKQ